jgi:hypothetical protein
MCARVCALRSNSCELWMTNVCCCTSALRTTDVCRSRCEPRNLRSHGCFPGMVCGANRGRVVVCCTGLRSGRHHMCPWSFLPASARQTHGREFAVSAFHDERRLLAGQGLSAGSYAELGPFLLIYTRVTQTSDMVLVCAPKGFEIGAGPRRQHLALIRR